MNLDILSSFCFKYALAGAGPMYSTGDTSAGSVGTGYIDLGLTDAFALSGGEGQMYMGVGEPLMVEALLTTTLNDAATPRVVLCTVTLESDYVTTFNGTLTTVLTLGTFGVGAKAGSLLIGFLPFGTAFYRYLRMAFTFHIAAGTAGTLTGGAISGFLLHDAQMNISYPSRITVG
jgi:hypothetical protein